MLSKVNGCLEFWMRYVEKEANHFRAITDASVLDEFWMLSFVYCSSVVIQIASWCTSVLSLWRKLSRNSPGWCRVTESYVVCPKSCGRKIGPLSSRSQFGYWGVCCHCAFLLIYDDVRLGWQQVDAVFGTPNYVSNACVKWLRIIYVNFRFQSRVRVARFHCLHWYCLSKRIWGNVGQNKAVCGLSYLPQWKRQSPHMIPIRGSSERRAIQGVYHHFVYLLYFFHTGRSLIRVFVQWNPVRATLGTFFISRTVLPKMVCRVSIHTFLLYVF